METACLSSISIAFTTIIQMIALNLVTTWGKGWGLAAWILWWINAVMATACCVGIPYIFTYNEARGIDCVPPGILLPLIAALTAAAGGGVICRYGELGADLQVPMIIVSYLFLGLGLPLSVAVDAVFLGRLFDKSFPVKQKVYQLMILCGPLGQGSFALQILGNVVQRGAFASYGTSSFLSSSGQSTVATASEFLGLISWGYGTFWWAFACIAIIHYTITAPKDLWKWDQSLSAWSMVFPWGVYTNAAVELGVVLDSRAFWVWSTVLTLMLVILWLANAFASVYGSANGKLLELPRGWGATYYSSGAEDEKGAAQAGNGDQSGRSDGKRNEEEGGLSNGTNGSSGGTDGTLRQRDRFDLSLDPAHRSIR